MEKYLPTGNKERDGKLPGMGGVYNSLNIGLYTYGHQNPLTVTDPSGLFSELYTGARGVRAHQVVFAYIQGTLPESFVRNTRFDRSIGNVLNRPDLGLSRPDVINTASRQVWELKPITHKTSPALAAKDQAQLAGYLQTLGGGVGGGAPYSLGDPSTIVNYEKGGVMAGTFYDSGKQFEVRLYPGEKGSGLLYYTLKETGRTVVDDIKDTVEQIGREMARNPPFPPIGGRQPQDPVPE